VKRGFVNQKLGKRPTHRARLRKAAMPAAWPHPGSPRGYGSPVATPSAGKPVQSR